MNKHLLRSLSETGRLLLGNRKAGRESEKEKGRKGKGENKERKERLSLPLKTLKLWCGRWAVTLITQNRMIRTVAVICS